VNFDKGKYDSWMLEVRGWKLEVGCWKPGANNQEQESPLPGGVSAGSDGVGKIRAIYAVSKTLLEFTALQCSRAMARRSGSGKFKSFLNLGRPQKRIHYDLHQSGFLKLSKLSIQM